MKVWFDLSNSPHINMFATMIRDLEREHEVVITCRPLANTIDLLELHGFQYNVVGVHYGGKTSAKIMGFPVRVLQLQSFLQRHRIDVAISQSSFHSPVVSRLLGVRSVYMNDNEHAMGNIPAFLCADKIMVPEFLRMDKLRRQYANPKKVVQYSGVKEGMYLWDLDERLARRRARDGEDARPRTVYVRPEPWTAQYYRGRRNFFDDVLLCLSEHAPVVVLPRDREQAAHYADPKFNGISVVTAALDIADIVPDCALFIGAGGTMTREMAVLGIPTISIYQDELLDVDKYLIEEGAFTHRPDLTSEEALEILNEASHRPPRKELLKKGKEAYDLVKSVILND